MIVKRQIVGWREFVDLPDLGLIGLKAKMDTGAKTSALHSDHFETYVQEDGSTWVEFKVSQTQPNKGRHVFTCNAPLIETRAIKSSNGETEMRHVISTRLVIGGKSCIVQITLTDRSEMRHPLLVGRAALNSRFLVNPSKTFLLGRRNPTSSDQTPA